MSIGPGTYNFAVQRRADWSVLLQFKDSTDAAINLTGSTVAAQAWDKGSCQ
jgi:NAD dependent epimerase/dehydratase family enzyme